MSNENALQAAPSLSPRSRLSSQGELNPEDHDTQIDTPQQSTEDASYPNPRASHDGRTSLCPFLGQPTPSLITLPEPGPAAGVLFVTSDVPERVVELPVIQKVLIQPHVIQQPEIHVIQTHRERVEVREIIKKVPKITYVDRPRIVEVPQVEFVEEKVWVPHIVQKLVHIPTIQEKEVIVQVPKKSTRYIEKRVEVPQITYVDRVVEVPVIRDVIREVVKHQVVEVPEEHIQKVPKVVVQRVEKIRYVPSPDHVEIREIPVEKVIIRACARPKPVPQPRPVPKDIFKEIHVELPVPGDIIDVPIPIEEERTRIVPKAVPGPVIERRIIKQIEKIVEVPVANPVERVRVVKTEHPVYKPIVREVDVMETVEKVVEVPRYVYIQEPQTVIKPKLVKEYCTLPPITTQAEPRRVAQQEPDGNSQPCTETPQLPPP